MPYDDLGTIVGTFLIAMFREPEKLRFRPLFAITSQNLSFDASVDVTEAGCAENVASS